MRGFIAALATLVAAALHAQPLPAAPEHPSGWIDKKPVTSHRFMVAAANPLATEAGYEIIRAGGNAIDAAIAVQLVLGLVEPQSSGLGGGAFLL
jgi:gamma-glutamyltranspeptidase/glutathione hydrolase